MKSWNWDTRKRRYVNDNVSADDNFGTSMHIYGDTLVVSSPNEDTTNSNSGAVYEFVRPSGGTTWTQQAMLKASDAASDDIMGDQVSGVKIYGDTIAVGARGVDAGGTNRRACYIFTRSGTTFGHNNKRLNPQQIMVLILVRL